MWHWGSWVEPLPISEKNWQVRHGDQPWYHKHWIGVFVGTWPIHAPGAPCIEFRIRKGEDKGRKRERSFTSIQMLHTHTRPEPGQPWKARGRKKRTHDGQTAKNSAGGGGEQTDLRNQPTRRNGPDQKQRTHLNPTTHYGEARGEN